MTLRLYNTLTRMKEEFKPLDPNNVRMYVCGPTVYDYAHIGNARPVIVFDVLFRLLQYLAQRGEWDDGKGETKVTYVRNITDVDDKINLRALRDYPDLPLNEAIRKVTERTANQFFADVNALGCLAPDFQPRATDHIKDMIEIIQRLLDRGHAYIALGSEGIEVLFSVLSMSDYGRLSQRNLIEQQAGARVDVEAHKKNPADFVLWKESTKDEPGWTAEFRPDSGYRANDQIVTIRGRSGWHIECSAMSWKFLGETFDIHGGGIDLVFPHHENELAQTRCAFSRPVMANVWMHNGFLQVEGQKMSKSLGNFRTINEELENWPGSTLKLAMLESHYRQPIDWTTDRLRIANKELGEWSKFWLNQNVAAPFALNRLRGTLQVNAHVITALSDDLNTPEALAVMRNLYKRAVHDESSALELLATGFFLGLWTEKNIGALVGGVRGSAPIHALSTKGEIFHKAKTAAANGAPHVITQLNNHLKIENLRFDVHQNDGYVTLEKINPNEKSSEENQVESLISQRLAARKAKNWAESDRIRDELAAMGVTLKDNKDGTTTWEVKQ
jgi:cysteinyl-tRNA synthetase